MSEKVLSLARPAIRELKAYQSARSLGHKGEIYLDANESPFDEGGKLNRYPEPQPAALRRRLAALYGCGESELFIGRGSDDAIDALVRTFCEAERDAILIFPPTYGVYEVAARIQGARVLKVNAGVEGPNAELVLAAWTPETKLVFLCSPNNPTGRSIPGEDIVAICQGLLGRAVVVLDEAYVEFSSRESFTSRATEFPNLVVLRTLSKAWGLAGARCGAAIGNPEVMALLQKVRAPYPLSTPSVNAVLEALTPEEATRARVGRLITSREKLAVALAALPDVTEVFPSDANFLLVKVTDPSRAITSCLEKGIVIRDRSREPGLENCVRISVGTDKENARLVEALGGAKAASNERTARRVRRTKETAIEAIAALDGPLEITVRTGIGFFDHMLEQLAKHGSFGLRLEVQGDLNVDEHHTVEDAAITLGECLKQALGDKRGIGRYGFLLPMDEAEAKVSLDLSGRSYFVFNGKFTRESVGGLPTELVPHFFRSLAESLGATLHIEVKGENNHHMVESCFKGVGRSLRQAFQRDGSGELPTTKGVL